MPLSYIEIIPSGRLPEEPMPLVVVMHGRGADATDLSGIAGEIDGKDGYRFVFPNAPGRFEPYPGMHSGFSWFDGWPPDPASIRRSRTLLLEFIAALVERYHVPAGRMVLAGFSQGGMMALDAGFRLPQPPAAIVVMSGALYETEAPSFERQPASGVLIIHGTGDDMIPVLAARRTRRVLEDARVRLEYHEFPMGHQISQESIVVVREFLQRAFSDE
jgi:phospholipase/carboxylesterase